MADFTDIDEANAEIGDLRQYVESLNSDIDELQYKVDDFGFWSESIHKAERLLESQDRRIRLHGLDPEYTYLELIDEVLRLVRAS